MIEENFPIIKKVESHYCGSDCVQLMFVYDKALSIAKIDESDEQKNELIFYNNRLDPYAKSKYINKYLTDERRKQFSYANLPEHKERIKLKRYNVVNQLLDYDTIYEIRRGSNHEIYVTYCKVLRVSDSVIVIQDKELSPAFYMNSEEFEQNYFSRTREANINDATQNKKQKKKIFVKRK